MDRIYLDNAATSFPKAPGLGKVMSDFLERDCTNINRTNSSLSYSLFERIYNLRQGIAGLYSYDKAECVLFSSGITQSLNMLIKGLFTKNDHILVSSLEHNSVMRPLVQCGIPFSRIPSDRYGYMDYDSMESLVRPNTKAMVICAAGNVSGAVQDIETIARFADKHGFLLIIDSAQATPYVEIDMSRYNIAAVAFAGHKSLLGPEGTGGMVLRKDLALSLEPLVSGGTGSQSDSEDVPTTLPDRLEAGTQNIPGILALAHSFDYVMKNFQSLHENEMAMTRRLYEGLSDLPGISVAGAPLDRCRTNVVSVTSSGKDIATICAELEERYNIETRVGMHCSPSSHQALGTYPEGTLRFSPGPFTKTEEIDFTIRAMKEIVCE